MAERHREARVARRWMVDDGDVAEGKVGGDVVRGDTSEVARGGDGEAGSGKGGEGLERRSEGVRSSEEGGDVMRGEESEGPGPRRDHEEGGP